MEEKLITIVVLPYSKALILKIRLEAKDIECDLEDINLIDGATTSTVRVKILEKDLSKAIPVLDEYLGKKTIVETGKTDVKDRHILVPIDFSVNSEKETVILYSILNRFK